MPTLTSRHTAAAVSARGRRAAAAAGALLTVFGLAGCSANVPPAPPPTTAASSDGSPTSSITAPPPRTTAEAEQLVKEVYEGYADAGGEIYETGDKALDNYYHYVTRNFAENDIKSVLEKADSHDLIALGRVLVRRVAIVKNEPNVISAHICIDSTNAQIIERGETPKPTPIGSVRANYVEIINLENSFKLNRSEPWQNREFCSQF